MGHEGLAELFHVPFLYKLRHKFDDEAWLTHGEGGGKGDAKPIGNQIIMIGNEGREWKMKQWKEGPRRGGGLLQCCTSSEMG